MYVECNGRIHQVRARARLSKGKTQTIAVKSASLADDVKTLKSASSSAFALAVELSRSLCHQLLESVGVGLRYYWDVIYRDTSHCDYKPLVSVRHCYSLSTTITQLRGEHRFSWLVVTALMRIWSWRGTNLWLA